MKTLIAEDDLTSRQTLSGFLTKSGFEVVEATNGAEAWDIMQDEGAPKLAIIDWIMPEMDGLELCRQIRTAETSVPPYLIMLTVKKDHADIINALENGADDYVTKPYDRRELKARVEVGRRMIGLQQNLSDKVEELEEAMEHIHTLQGMLPICSHCKKIRDSEDYWHDVELYIRNHSGVKFTHTVCPDCLSKHYADINSNDG